MKIYITAKSIGKRKNYIEKQNFDISDDVKVLKSLLIAIVKIQVAIFNSTQMINYLTTNNIEAMAEQGKVGFGTKYNDNKANEKEAIETMLQAFEDGLFKVFINDEEYDKLDEDILIKEEDTVTFIRLTMLAGRLW